MAELFCLISSSCWKSILWFFLYFLLVISAFQPLPDFLFYHSEFRYWENSSFWSTFSNKVLNTIRFSHFLILLVEFYYLWMEDLLLWWHFLTVTLHLKERKNYVIVIIGLSDYQNSDECDNGFYCMTRRTLWRFLVVTR